MIWVILKNITLIKPNCHIQKNTHYVLEQAKPNQNKQKEKNNKQEEKSDT